MPSGLPALSSLSRSFGSLMRTGLAVRSYLKLVRARGADHLLGRNAVDPLGIDAHEILAAAGDDVGPEAVGAEIFEELDLRLIDEIGVRPLPARIARLAIHFSTSSRNVSTSIPVRVAATILIKLLQRQLRDRLAIAGQHGPERLDLGELGLCLHDRRHAIKAIDELRVDRMLDPQRAVLVEGRDALRERHEVRGLRRRSSHGRI